MIARTELFSVRTRGRGTLEITDQVSTIVSRSQLRDGLATVFVQHTSASLIIFENADPSARHDLHAYFDRLVPDAASYFQHTLEGDDDMSAHLRMVLTRTSEQIPVQNGRLCLGTWQGLFLFEHRTSPHTRSLAVSLLGTA